VIQLWDCKKPIKKPKKPTKNPQKTHKNKKGSRRLPKKGPRGPFLFTDRSADLQKIEKKIKKH
jgi:hypothetical protein